MPALFQKGELRVWGIGLTEDNLGRRGGLGRIGVEEGHQVVLHDILNERTAEADERDTYDNSEEGKPSVGLSAGRVGIELCGK